MSKIIVEPKLDCEKKTAFTHGYLRSKRQRKCVRSQPVCECEVWTPQCAQRRRKYCFPKTAAKKETKWNMFLIASERLFFSSLLDSENIQAPKSTYGTSRTIHKNCANLAFENSSLPLFVAAVVVVARSEKIYLCRFGERARARIYRVHMQCNYIRSFHSFFFFFFFCFSYSSLNSEFVAWQTHSVQVLSLRAYEFCSILCSRHSFHLRYVFGSFCVCALWLEYVYVCVCSCADKK